MSAARNAVRVTIGGEELTVRSELPPEYTREVAAYLDAALKRVRDAAPALELHKAAILAALSIVDQYFKAVRELDVLRTDVDSTSARLRTEIEDRLNAIHLAARE